MMRWRLRCCGCWRCGSRCEWGQRRVCGVGRLPGVSGDRVVLIREGIYGGRGSETVIDTVIARSFRKGLRWSNETCRVIEAA
jgi:hypothetical protein